jgi:16S rRNA (guanine527-N7)-methyltransferase
MPVPPWFVGVLERELRPWLSLSAEQIEKLYTHYQLLQRWNKKINLTSVEPGDEMVIRHYCESLFFGRHLPDDAFSMADIGSGAGFPGVPIAILKPSCRVILVESNQRKAVFLREAIRGLDNISVVAARAEDLSTTYDWLVSRAVNPTEVAALGPRVAPRIGLMLGESDFLELKADKHIAWREPIQLPWGDRRICVYGEVSRGTL